jgi:hypothetical protein
VLRPLSRAIDRNARPDDPEYLQLADRGRARPLPVRRARRGARLVKDAERLALWKSRRDELLDEIERLDTMTRGPVGIRVIGPAP